MESLTKKVNNDYLTYSTNPAIIPQMSKEEGGKHSTGWEEKKVIWKESDLTHMVKNEAYCQSTFSNGRKIKDEVTAMYFLAVDFDKGETTFENYKNEKVAKFNFTVLMHTTINHQKEIKNIVNGEEVINLPKDKFRLIVPLSRPISNNEAELIKKSGIIQSTFSLNPDDIDMSFIDSNRFFKQNPNAVIYFHDKDEVLNSEYLINNSTPSQNSNSSKKNQKTKKTFANSDILTKQDLTKIKVQDIIKKEKIFCPFCDPKQRTHPNNANAFIDINPAGMKYIYCSSENQTFWMDSENYDLEKCKIFWNTSLGCPSLVRYESGNEVDQSVYYIFKNDSDFKNYCCNYKIDPSIKDYLPRREIIFNPGKPSGLHDDFYNIFEETQYMKKDYSSLQKIELSNVINSLSSKTPIISELLSNIFGEPDYIERFLNWMSYILIERKKSDTAWLITSEEEGIGKDLMFNRILKPIFGEKQSQLLNGKRIGKNFNSQDMNCFLRGYNEVFSSGDSTGNNSRKEWLKDAITSKKQTIEFKGKDTIESDNFMNFILFSNNVSPILLDAKDRRYNVIRNQKSKKVDKLSFFHGRKFLESDIANELDLFSDIVFSLDYDIDLANTTIDTEAKNKIIALSSDPYEDFVKAVKAGDVDYFLLDEIFGTASSNFIIKNSIEEEIEEILTKNKAILAKFMKDIVNYHFSGVPLNKVLNKLKSKGLESKTIRTNLVRVTRVYM